MPNYLHLKIRKSREIVDVFELW